MPVATGGSRVLLHELRLAPLADRKYSSPFRRAARAETLCYFFQTPRPPCTNSRQFNAFHIRQDFRMFLAHKAQSNYATLYFAHNQFPYH